MGAPLPDGSAGKDVIRAVQWALLSVGIALPNLDLDLPCDRETQLAIARYRVSRDLPPSQQLIDGDLLRRLDLELSFLEESGGAEMSEVLQKDRNLLRLDPFTASLLGQRLNLQAFDKTIIDKWRRMAELGDRMCFRLSLDLGFKIAIWFNETIAEPIIFKDFVKINGPADHVFFDLTKSHEVYKSFIVSHNQGKLPAKKLIDLAAQTRPDILSHRPPDFDWYEIKPMSVYGINDSVNKLVKLLALYLPLPYRPGRRYTPTRNHRLGEFVCPFGHRLAVDLEVERSMPGIIMWTLCIEGEYVEYFHRYTIVKGLLQILLALCLILPEAGVVGAEGAATYAALIRIYAATQGLVLVVLKAAQ